MLKKLSVKVAFCLFFLVFPLTPFVIEIQAEESEFQDQKKVPVGISDESKLHFATWNIRHLGKNPPVRGRCELKTIVRILSQYDFIAIVELMPGDVKDKKPDDEKIELGDDADLREILKKIRKKYGRKFNYLISPQVGWKGSPYKEHYAFIYDEELISIVPDPTDGTNGSVYHEPVKKPDNRMEAKGIFSRSPFWATFRADKFDFTVIVVHLIYGSQKKEDLAIRRLEIMGLKGVYDFVQNRDEKEQDILLVGDFNMPPSDDSFDALRNRSNSDLEVTPLFSIENGDVSNLARTPYLYDNIFFQQKYVKEYLDSCIDKYQLTYYGGNKGKASLVSDHLPVTAQFRTDLEDDDGDKADNAAGNSESTEQ